MPLTRDSVTPLYLQIAAELHQKIERGRYQPGGLLPSESDLMARFGVSRVTVRLAIGRLAQEGLVERHRGKGTFVKGKRLQHDLNTLQGFHDALLLQGRATDMRLVRAEKRYLPAVVCKAMRTRARVGLFLQRLHRIDGEPMALASTYLPRDALSLTREVLESRSSYEVIETVLGLPIDHARLSIRVGRADPDGSRHLNLPEAAVVLVMERISYGADDRACEHTVFQITPERYEFVLDSEGGPRLAGGSTRRRRADEAV